MRRPQLNKLVRSGYLTGARWSPTDSEFTRAINPALTSTRRGRGAASGVLQVGISSPSPSAGQVGVSSPSPSAGLTREEEGAFAPSLVSDEPPRRLQADLARSAPAPPDSSQGSGAPSAPTDTLHLCLRTEHEAGRPRSERSPHSRAPLSLASKLERGGPSSGLLAPAPP